MIMKPLLIFATIFFFSCTTRQHQEKEKSQNSLEIELQNPVIAGYFADPSIVQHEGKFYLYTTADPWGEDFLSCWVSDDFNHWTFNRLNWPTKEECMSPTSNNHKVWAPSVIEKDGIFYMYISVGSEVWCGRAKHPLGPWQNMLVDKPLIPFDTTMYYHVIDAEAFIDDDGRSYLYWGSGWDWKNGRCFAAELNEDMCSFKTEKKEITPSHYFEAPFMVKHNNKYYLTYSEGKTIDETYEVRYAIGDSPLGPFDEALNSPILTMNDSLLVYGPGHHTVMNYQNKNYIVYHRHSLPFVTGTALRQICINELHFNDSKNEIQTVIPYDVQSFPHLSKQKREYIHPTNITASSEKDEHTKSENILDNNFATLWESDNYDITPNLTIDFDGITRIESMEIRFEYPWKEYKIKVEISQDKQEWISVAEFWKNGISGSPVTISIGETIQSIRLSFAEDKEVKSAIWDISFY